MVYEGKYRGQSVAVETVYNTKYQKVILDFHTEVAMIKSLRHPNIVHAMGACIDPICLVTEFCTRGSYLVYYRNTEVTLGVETKAA